MLHNNRSHHGNYSSQREDESKKRQQLHEAANSQALNAFTKAFPNSHNDRSQGRFVQDKCLCDRTLCKMIHKSRPRFEQLQHELRKFNANDSRQDHNWKHMDVCELDKRWSGLYGGVNSKTK